MIVQNTGYTGYYFRVLKEGMVAPSDQLEHISLPALAISVIEANRLMHHDKDDVEGIRNLLKVDELSESWRNTFQKEARWQDSRYELTVDQEKLKKQERISILLTGSVDGEKILKYTVFRDTIRI